MNSQEMFLRPELPMDDAMTRAIGNWVAHDQTTSRLAEPLAEPYLHEYLEEAEQMGRSRGLAACRAVWWPAAAIVAVVGILIHLLS